MAAESVRQGMSGYDVSALQRALKLAGYAVAVDGLYGPKTDSAVRKFQAKAKVKIDGQVAGETWAALGKAAHVKRTKADYGDAIRMACAVRNNAAMWGTALGDQDLLAWVRQVDDNLAAALGREIPPNNIKNETLQGVVAVALAIPVLSAEAVAVAGLATAAAMLAWAVWTGGTGAKVIKAAATRAPNVTSTYKGTTPTGKGSLKVNLKGNPRKDLNKLWRVARRLWVWLAVGAGIAVDLAAAGVQVASSVWGVLLLVGGAIMVLAKRKG